MQNDYLLSYCNDTVKKSFTLMPDPYWPTRVYSIGKHLREYGYYPSWMPLCVYTDHGAVDSYKPAKHELESDAPIQLRHSPTSKIAWEKYSTTPCFLMLSPFVFYRNKHNIYPMTNAYGTIAFPAHGTQYIDDVSDIKLYIEQLLNLPSKFQPVSVCLHMSDIVKGKHHIFLKYKIPVYTAGNYLDDRFTQRFYNIIKNFKYATSNMVGSYLYYCVEMGIPFSIYGNKQSFVNHGDPNLPPGKYDPYANSPYFQKATNMFSGLFTEISPAQKNYVAKTLGLNEGLSRKKMAWVLYSAFFKWIFSIASIRFAYKIFCYILRKLNLNTKTN